MKRVEFLSRFEPLRKMCNGNAPEICLKYDIKYHDYRYAINGKLTDEARLSRIWACIEEFVSEQIIKAIEVKQIRYRVTSISQKLCPQNSTVMV